MNHESLHAHHSMDYVELTVTDLADSKRFFATAFGWSFNDYGPEYAGIQGAGREMGGLHQVKPDDLRTGKGALVILYSKDLDKTVSQVKNAGGAITVAPYPFPGGRRFHFTDPTGNELAVWSER